MPPSRVSGILSHLLTFGFFYGVKMMNERILDLLGEEKLKKIQNCNVLLIGLGGVGGYAFEALVRSGFQNITIVDFDTFEESNLNRQIYALQKTLGKSKCEVASFRAHEINPNVTVQIMNERLTKDKITKDFLSSFDFVIDACDDVMVKIALFEQCSFSKKKFISCMGTANRTHPEFLEITTLDKTYNDPLAKKIRNSFKNSSILKAKVVWSREMPVKQKKLGTICSVPMSAGSLLASFVINHL